MFHSLAVKLCFLTVKYSSTLKVIGPVHYVCVKIYPKTRFCFERLGYTLLEFIVAIIILTHGISHA